MGTLLLECPLCCSETFTCHDSLKYHLLSISDNLFCPECGERFEKIFDLAMHLGVHTSNSETCTSNISTTEDAHLIVLDVDVKQELTEAITSDGHSTLQELNTSTVEHITDVAETNKVEEYEDLYFCSSCRINFTSIQEHLEKFHNGHQVLLEDEDTLDNESNVISDEDKETHNVETNESVIKPEGYHAVQEEECVDKNGRLYTRRVVKIEKFWDDSQIKPKIINGKRPSPMGNSNNIVDSLETDNNNSENVDEISEFLQCSKCDKKFLTLELYSNHKCSGASSSKTDLQKCTKCKGIFINSDYLKEHMKTHKNKASNTVNENVSLPPFVCKVCKTEFATFKSLRLHMRMHLPVKSKIIEPPAPYGMHGEEIDSVKSSLEMFVCKICNKPYNKQYEEAHVKFHSNESDFNCDICNRKFHTQENLTMHIRAHSDQKKFVCSYCKKTFLTSDKLEAHLSTKCQKRRYECQYCGRRFARPHEKVKHERIHTGEKPHVCEICGKAFRVSYCLTLHLRTHSGTRPYKCNHCGKRFKAHSVYNHHLLTHSDDRKYKCPYCPKTFKTGVQLAGHKNSHTKPFTCTECNRPFASLYAVRSHMETHQRQNNLKYKCWICGASYARAFALRDHVKDQHVTERDTRVDVDAIILENYDYSLSDNMEADEVMLGDPEENMLIDIGSEVQDIGMPVVEIEPEAHA